MFLKIEPQELKILTVSEHVAIASLQVYLSVRVNDELSDGVFRYTRIWSRDNGGTWQVVGGQVSNVLDSNQDDA